MNETRTLKFPINDNPISDSRIKQETNELKKKIIDEFSHTIPIQDFQLLFETIDNSITCYSKNSWMISVSNDSKSLWNNDRFPELYGMILKCGKQELKQIIDKSKVTRSEGKYLSINWITSVLRSSDKKRVQCELELNYKPELDSIRNWMDSNRGNLELLKRETSLRFHELGMKISRNESLSGNVKGLLRKQLDEKHKLALDFIEKRKNG